MAAGDHPEVKAGDGEQNGVIDDQKCATRFGVVRTRRTAKERNYDENLRDNEEPEDDGEVEAEQMIEGRAVERAIGRKPVHSSGETGSDKAVSGETVSDG
jgi:hypothetical protein